MTRSANEVFKKHLRADQRRMAKTRSEELIAEYKTLQELRKARELTQTRIAEILGISQDNVSRIEKRSDVLLSTLRSYVEAMGGELDLVVKFPDHAPIHLETLSDIGNHKDGPRS